MPQPTKVVSPTDAKQLQSVLQELEGLYIKPATMSPDVDASLSIPPDPSLIGIGKDVYEQISLALAAGKRHLMFYGPPGTGKTTLAQYVAGILGPTYQMITGSADWSSQDLIGGYQPTGGGIRFAPGVLLESFDQPVIIDELNRCDIDKAIGPLFTVLSGQPTTLPYSTNPADEAAPRYVILPLPKPGKEPHEFSPSPEWRILATINSLDKASLYQMSYALTRRFGWVLVDVPADLAAFVREFYRAKVPNAGEVDENAVSPLAVIWEAVNRARRIGPAPIIDIIFACTRSDAKIDLFGPITEVTRKLYINSIYCFILPMLDGILHDQALEIVKALTSGLLITEGSETHEILRARVLEMAV